MALSDYNALDKVLFQFDFYPFSDKLIRYTLRQNKKGVYYLLREDNLYEKPKETDESYYHVPPAKILYIVDGEEAYDEMMTKYWRYRLYRASYWAWKCKGFVWEKLDGCPTKTQFLSFNTGQEEATTLSEIANPDVYGESFVLNDAKYEVYRALPVTV